MIEPRKGNLWNVALLRPGRGQAPSQVESGVTIVGTTMMAQTVPEITTPTMLMTRAPSDA